MSRHFLRLVPIILTFVVSAFAVTNAMGESKETELSCEAHLLSDHVGSKGEAALDAEIEKFVSLSERALSYRAVTIDFYRQLEKKLNRDEPLSGNDLDLLNAGMNEHLAIRVEMLDIAHRHECWPALDEEGLRKYHISREHQYKGVLLSLASALVLYDNYLLAVSTFEENPKLRRLLNAADSGYHIGRNELMKVSLSYVSATNRSKARVAINYYEHWQPNFAALVEQDKRLKYLYLLIKQSPSYNMTRKWSPLYVLSNVFNLFGEVTVDQLTRAAQEGSNLFSMAFGNTVGLVELRKGKLYGEKSVEGVLHKQLQPGDILLEKTPFRLTDQFIPGHWGHVAIWVGDEADLRTLGIWDHPLVRTYQARIKEGHGVVEALRSGVTMSSLSHFLNVDDLAVMRSSSMTKEKRAELVLHALRQVGKAYDFNFDVETTERIVCSELVYVTYTDQSWPTEKTLGRSTISPDQVASRLYRGDEFKLVLLYHDGKPVTSHPLLAMKQLMNI